MIISFLFGAFTLWLLAITMTIVWYGILIGIACVAISIAMVLYLIVWALTSLQGIFSDRRRSEVEG